MYWTYHCRLFWPAILQDYLIKPERRNMEICIETKERNSITPLIMIYYYRTKKKPVSSLWTKYLDKYERIGQKTNSLCWGGQKSALILMPLITIHYSHTTKIYLTFIHALHSITYSRRVVTNRRLWWYSTSHGLRAWTLKVASIPMPLITMHYFKQKYTN